MAVPVADGKGVLNSPVAGGMGFRGEGNGEEGEERAGLAPGVGLDRTLEPQAASSNRKIPPATLFPRNVRCRTETSCMGDPEASRLALALLRAGEILQSLPIPNQDVTAPLRADPSHPGPPAQDPDGRLQGGACLVGSEMCIRDSSRVVPAIRAISSRERGMVIQMPWGSGCPARSARVSNT